MIVTSPQSGSAVTPALKVGLSRREAVLRLLGAVSAPLVPRIAHAQAWPSRPIRLVLGFGAGGTTDAIARYYAQKISEVLGAPVIVDNKPGANQMVAVHATMAAAPDGHTLYVATASALSQGPGVRKDLPYDPLRDFSYVGLLVTAPGVIVASPGLPVRTMRELMAYAAQNSGKLNYGSAGVGAASHLQTEYLLRVTGMKIAHIPYKSDADIMRELLAGTVHIGMSSVQGAMPSIAAGRVRALAVTGARRMRALPDVPSLRELDVKGIEGVDPYSYYGVVGPRGMPAAVVGRLNAAINQVSRMLAVIAHAQDHLYAEPAPGSPEAFREYVRHDMLKWRAFAKYVKLGD